MPKNKNQEKTFDLRTLEYALSAGQVQTKDYDQFLKALPDDEGNYDLIELKDDEENDFDDVEEDEDFEEEDEEEDEEE